MIPGQGTKIPHAAWWGQRKKKVKNKVSEKRRQERVGERGVGKRENRQEQVLTRTRCAAAGDTAPTTFSKFRIINA